MTSTLNRPVPRHPTAPAPVTARFRCSPAADSWEWSPELHDLLGVPAVGAAPRARLLLDLLQPADRQRVREALAGCTGRRPFALEVRATRPDGDARTVVLAGEPVIDETGRVPAVDGLCVDVSGARDRAGEPERVRALETEIAQLRTAMASRAAIEQAKGILMLLTGCGEQPAFELLTHISSHTHRKVREVAEAVTGSAAGGGRLPEDIAAILHDACPPGAPPR